MIYGIRLDLDQGKASICEHENKLPIQLTYKLVCTRTSNDLNPCKIEVMGRQPIPVGRSFAMTNQ